MKAKILIFIIAVIRAGIFFMVPGCSEKGEPEAEVAHTNESENIIHMHQEEMDKYGIAVGAAEPGELKLEITLPGEIAINTDNMAHIVPRVTGIVREVNVRLGDKVKQGDVLAVLDSRELADAKADYLAARERTALAQANFEREEKLWRDKISSEQEYLSARQNLAEMKITLRSSRQKLIAMGFTPDYLEKLPQEADEPFTRYEITAPFEGTIIEKHIALGEVLKDDAEILIVADLSTVWVNLQVYQKDLPLIRVGQEVCLESRPCLPETHGVIDYVGPIVGTKTRTALARVVLPNPTGELRPGLFVNAKVAIRRERVDVLVNKDHIQYVNDEPCVFVEMADGFEARPVALGESNEDYVVITSGLAAGERYVTGNSFLLKSEWEKAAGGGHINDGHTHIH
ncbi:MAG: hypothetical protein AMJ79_02250 [Phycisphaerae bacterium SM23_30]|nr:MAG: hypothetical protein AMJ79_02250 [Phycisphaerae bacterium SM23_30]